jgi:methyl-accepting chemotaxis protein
MTEHGTTGEEHLPMLQEVLPPDGAGGFDLHTSVYKPRLENMSEQLRQTSAQIEEAIVEVCISIQGVADRARAGSQRTTDFLGRSGTDEHGERSFEALIEACSETMVKLMQTASRVAEVAMETAERVQQIDRTSREINEALVRLEEIAMSNKILALNARIEGARSSEQGAGFSAVAVELAAQTDKSQQVTAQIGDLVVRLRAIAAATHAELQQMQTETDRRIVECRGEVDQALDELRGTHGRMEEMLTFLTEEGKLLSRDIGAAVRGLQFQDRVSQRIAHVVHDLDALRDHLLDPGNPREPAFSGYSMQEEREIYGVAGQESAGGEVELF